MANCMQLALKADQLTFPISLSFSLSLSLMRVYLCACASVPVSLLAPILSHPAAACSLRLINVNTFCIRRKRDNLGKLKVGGEVRTSLTTPNRLKPRERKRKKKELTPTKSYADGKENKEEEPKLMSCCYYCSILRSPRWNCVTYQQQQQRQRMTLMMHLHPWPAAVHSHWHAPHNAFWE